MGLERSPETKAQRSSCSTVAGLHRGIACVPQGVLHSAEPRPRDTWASETGSCAESGKTKQGK